MPELTCGSEWAAQRRSELSLSPLVWIEDVAGLVLLRPYDGDHRKVLELLQVVALDVVELHGDDERLGYLPIGTKVDVTDDGRERGRPHVFGELSVIEAFCCRDGLSQDLQLGIAPRSHVVTEWVDPLRGGTGLIAIDQLQNDGEAHGRRGHPEVVVDNAVEQRNQLHLEGRSKKADHSQSNNIWLTDDLHDEADDTDSLGR